MEKEQIIAELMSLRGGLSIVSKMTDEMRARQKMIKDQEFNIEDIKRDLAHIESMREGALLHKKYLDGHKNALSNAGIEAKERAESWVKIGFFDDEKDMAFGFVGAIVGSILLGGWGNAIGSGAISAIGVFVGLFIYPLLGLVTLPLRRKKAEKKEYKRLTDMYERQIKSDEQYMLREIANELNLFHINYSKITCLEDLELVAEQYKNSLEREKRKLEDMTREADVEIEEISQKTQLITSAMKSTYVDVVTESDWDSIDLIIHYFETGRADTLKEALQQVDRQKQTDQIVRAIKEASLSISRHIESAFSKMGQALALSFNKLDSSLKTISSQIEKNQRISLDSNERLLAKIDEQINVTEMNAVLLEKANKTSSELLDDLRYNQRFWIK